MVRQHSLDPVVEAVEQESAVSSVMEGVPWNGSNDCTWLPVVVRFEVVGEWVVVSVQGFRRKD